jgi:hypothetical protein
MEYDIIGDIHGNSEALKALLDRLGYNHTSGSWSSPPGRMILFVGDFIDRKEDQMEVIATVRSLIDAGRAQAIMGNHELNAIAWHRGFREKNCKNWKQHRAFLRSFRYRRPKHDELVDWFMTLPLWLDLPELRVVHACWDPGAIAFIENQLGGARLSEEQIESATAGKSNTIRQDGTRGAEDSLFSAVETLLKGVEVELPEGVSFLDKDGNRRDSVRIDWWKQQPASYADVSRTKVDDRAAMEAPLPHGVLPGYDELKPLFLGHYWMTGTPELLSPKIACVDYSAGKDGPLVAYCWRGEETLNADGFRSTLEVTA